MKKIYKSKKTALIVILLLVISTIFGCNKEVLKENEVLLEVYFLDVGQGDSTLIKTPGGETILIDGGDNKYGAKVVSYLKNLGLDKIDYLIATHPDADHIGGLDDVLYNFEVLNIYAPKVQHNTKTFEDFLLAVKSNNQKIKVAKAGVKLNIQDIDARFLAPVNEYGKDLNSWSGVLKINYGETSFLFMGDATKKSESHMLDIKTDLKSSVLKVGHHGSNTSSSEEFLNAVAPQYGIISLGENNKYNHPNDDVLESLLQRNIEIHRTDQEGTILAESDGKNITFKSVNLEKNRNSNVEINLNNYNPLQNETIYLNVENLSDKDFKAIVHYKSKDSIYEGNTDIPMPINIGRAAKDFPVVIDIEIYDKENIIKESITFTPK